MMQGLLDDPNSAGLLSLGLRLMSTPGNFGQALGQAGLGAMGDIQQMKAQQQAQKTRALQERMLDMQLQQATAEQKRRQAMQDAAKASFSPGQMLPEGVAGPQLPPQFDVRGFAERMAALGDPSMLMQMEKPPEAFTLAPGARRFVGERMVAENPASGGAEDKDVALLKLIHGENTPAFMAALRQLEKKRTTHAPPSQMNNYGSPVAGVGPDGQPVFFQPSRSGGAPAIVPGVRPTADAEKPLTEGQAKAVLFASRMRASDQILEKLSQKGVTTTVPGAMGNNTTGSVVSALMSAEQQQLAQGKRDFVSAVLRRESGAVISDDEFRNAERQYFPQIGDSAEVIRQKAENRRIAIEGMMADVPKGRRGEIDQIVGGDGSGDADPLNLRGR